MTTRLIQPLLLLLGLFACSISIAQQRLEPDFSYNSQQQAPETFQAGVHYTVLDNPVRVSDPSKVEVVEVFWYGCSHCFHFEPLIKPWKAQLPEDVNFVLMPVIWNETTELHARMYYTARQLGVIDSLHDTLFRAMNIKKHKLKSESEVRKIFEENGVEKTEFNKAFNSFSVSSLVNLAGSRVRSYGIQGTPEMVVHGKYRVSARQTGSQEKMLEVVNFLVDQERLKLAALNAGNTSK